MTRSTTMFCDWTLQCAAIVAVLFVLIAGTAHGAVPVEQERIIIEEALRAKISPSLVLAVATVEQARGRHRIWSMRGRVRREVAHLRTLMDQSSNRMDIALARYGRNLEGLEARRYISTVRAWTRRFDADARKAARSINASPVFRKVILDDFDDGIARRVLRARGTLDDFPIRPRRRS